MDDRGTQLACPADASLWDRLVAAGLKDNEVCSLAKRMAADKSTLASLKMTPESHLMIHARQLLAEGIVRTQYSHTHTHTHISVVMMADLMLLKYIHLCQSETCHANAHSSP